MTIDREARRGRRPRRLRHRGAPQPTVRPVVADRRCSATSPPGTTRSDALDVDDADHHERPGEDRRGLRDAVTSADGRVDPCWSAANTAPVYPGSDRTSPGQRPADLLENYRPLRRRWDQDVVDLAGQLPHSLARLHRHAAAAGRRAAVVWHGPSLHPAGLAEIAAYFGDGDSANNIFWPASHHQPPDRALPAALRASRARCSGAGDRRARRPVLHAPQQPGRLDRVRLTSTSHRCTGNGLRRRKLTEQQPTTVGSPQQVLDKTPTFRRAVRRLPAPAVLVDHAGLPLAWRRAAGPAGGDPSRDAAGSSRHAAPRTCQRTPRPTLGAWRPGRPLGRPPTATTARSASPSALSSSRPSSRLNSRRSARCRPRVGTRPAVEAGEEPLRAEVVMPRCLSGGRRVGRDRHPRVRRAAAPEPTSGTPGAAVGAAP